MSKDKDAPRPPKANEYLVEAGEGEDRDMLLGRLALEPGVRHASLAAGYASGMFGDSHETPIKTRVAILGDAAREARAGGKGMSSDILMTQAMVLDTMFTELAARAATSMGRNLEVTDRYMRLALKAQANCRSTIEALAKLHQPREQVVKHVHVNEGGQAIVADQFHQHTGGSANAGWPEQPHATRTSGDGPSMLGADSQGDGVPISGGARAEAVPHARRQRKRRAEG